MTPRRFSRWAPAALWCLLFATLHVYWALGGSLGLASSAGTRLAEQRPALFVGLGLWGVAALLVAGALVVRRTAHGASRTLRLLVGAVAVLLLARGLLLELALLLDLGGIRAAVGHQETVASLLLWNPWFVLGGLAMALVSRRST